MDNRYLYFAFGSNLNTARMESRCPDCRLVGPATLPGWRIVERLYADIEAGRGAVRGVLYGVSGYDLARLDAYEGAPHVYARRVVMVWHGGRQYRAFTYIMTPGIARLRAGVSFPEDYRAICAAGAEEHNLSIPLFTKLEDFR